MNTPDPNLLTTIAIDGNQYRISFVKTILIGSDIKADIYSIENDVRNELVLYTIHRGVKTVPKSPAPGRTCDTGFLKGKGTLVVELENGGANTYYFENEGTNNQSVKISTGETFHWTAPLDSELSYFELTDALIPAARPIQPRAPSIPAPHAEQNIAVPTRKLFLISRSLNDIQSQALLSLIDRPLEEISVAFIANAADMEGDAKQRAEDAIKIIEHIGVHYEKVDLQAYLHHPIALLQSLGHKNVIWVGDGNVYYLRWLLHATRADEIIVHLTANGTVTYVGSGAGATVAGPTLKHFDSVHKPDGIPKIQPEGLKLTDRIVVPHIDDANYADAAKEIVLRYQRDGYPATPLKDDQVLLVRGDDQRII